MFCIVGLNFLPKAFDTGILPLILQNGKKETKLIFQILRKKVDQANIITATH